MVEKLGTQEKDFRKATELNKTLQEELDTREEQDKKNTALMQLLNTQLEDQKKRYDDLLADETENNKNLQAEMMQLKQHLLQTETGRDTYVPLLCIQPPWFCCLEHSSASLVP